MKVGWVLVARKSNSGQTRKNVRLVEEREDSRSTRDEKLNDCREQQIRESDSRKGVPHMEGSPGN